MDSSQNGGLIVGGIATIQPSVGTPYPPYVTAAGGGVAFLAMSQNLYASILDTNAWRLLSPTLFQSASSVCGYSTNNYYYYMTQQGDYLWVGFSLFGVSPRQHCIWALSVRQLLTSAAAGGVWYQVKPALAQYWIPAGQVCSIAGDQDGNVFFLQCNVGYILQGNLASNTLRILAGQGRFGYADGMPQTSLFNSLTLIIAHSQRVYVTDTGNCLIREIDPVSGIVSTVAGVAGVCERQDGLRAGLRYPSNFTPTQYDGFFVFMDQGPDEAAPTVRQFHTDSAYVRTIQSLKTQPVSSLLCFADRLSVVSANTFYDLTVQT